MAKTKSGKIQRRKNFWGYLFIAPNFIGFIAFMLVPILMSLYFSFTDYDVITSANFVGLDNYISLFQDDQFITALLNTLWYCVLTVPAGVVLALLLAVLFNRQVPGIGVFRTLTFIPVITSMVAVSLVWSMLYEDNGGLLNTLLGYLNLPPVHWLTDTNMAMISVAVMSVWKGLGYNMTIFLAGLQGVPHDLYEAATIDGASTIDKFFHITLPSIRGTTFYLLINLINGAMNIFIQVFLLTKGNPVGTTDVMMNYIYTRAFNYFEFGYAAACGLMMGVFVFTTSMFLKRYLRYGQDQ